MVRSILTFASLTDLGPTSGRHEVAESTLHGPNPAFTTFSLRGKRSDDFELSD